MTEIEFQQLLNEVLEEQKEKQIEDYVNGRIDTLKKRTQYSGINAGALAVEGAKAVHANPIRYCGKTVLRAMRHRFQVAHGKNMVAYRVSLKIRDDGLFSVAQKAFGSATASK